MHSPPALRNLHAHAAHFKPRGTQLSIPPVTVPRGSGSPSHAFRNPTASRLLISVWRHAMHPLTRCTHSKHKLCCYFAGRSFFTLSHVSAKRYSIVHIQLRGDWQHRYGKC
ncbi:hypothetical protein E2C01_013816 [Portunus trituberculatus]|uniref:Uncharacterized protein n=1 Tax=Portunus trituberculatus TaxID=210409 RepID=A0A5B7DI21_PORTR|nr:hypothetical protein [Portunus trituberculatus]